MSYAVIAGRTVLSYHVYLIDAEQACELARLRGVLWAKTVCLL
jgi:hypothetical protein